MVMVSIHALKRLVTVFRIYLVIAQTPTEPALTAGQQGTRIVHFLTDLYWSVKTSRPELSKLCGEDCAKL